MRWLYLALDRSQRIQGAYNTRKKVQEAIEGKDWHAVAMDKKVFTSIAKDHTNSRCSHCHEPWPCTTERVRRELAGGGK